jgi:hypothetical protein
METKHFHRTPPKNTGADGPGDGDHLGISDNDKGGVRVAIRNERVIIPRGGYLATDAQGRALPAIGVEVNLVKGEDGKMQKVPVPRESYWPANTSTPERMEAVNIPRRTAEFDLTHGEVEELVAHLMEHLAAQA